MKINSDEYINRSDYFKHLQTNVGTYSPTWIHHHNTQNFKKLLAFSG